MDQPKLDRRQFLHATAGVATAAAMASPASALARSLAPAKDQIAPLTVGFWAGTRFTSATQLRSGDSTIERATLTFRGYGEEGPITHIEVVSNVQTETGVKQIPFRAWTAPPQGGWQSKFVVPIDSQSGLVLNVHQTIEGKEQSQLLTFGLGAQSGVKFKEGIYIIAGGQADLTGLGFLKESPAGPRMEEKQWNTVRQYVSLTIERV